ncbi:hypothetical protein N7488_002381 [Penicillium malachiteum]|nr:hypothetical protein N7488_002381 [Penicillium malachiteum]
MESKLPRFDILLLSLVYSVIQGDVVHDGTFFRFALGIPPARALECGDLSSDCDEYFPRNSFTDYDQRFDDNGNHHHLRCCFGHPNCLNLYPRGLVVGFNILPAMVLLGLASQRFTDHRILTRRL